MTWREEAKELNISLYHKKKVDVLSEIEAKKNKPAGKTKVVISRQEAVNVCCAALKAHAASKGLYPDKEILISRWYLQMNRNNMTFIGQELDMTKINKDESVVTPETTQPAETATPPEETGDAEPETEPTETEETKDERAGTDGAEATEATEATEAVDGSCVPEGA